MKIHGSFSYQMKDFIKSYFLLQNSGSSSKRILGLRKIIFIINGIAAFSIILYYGLLLLAKYLVRNPTFMGVFESDLSIVIEKTSMYANILIIIMMMIILIDILYIFQPFTRMKIIITYLQKRHLYEDAYEIHIDEKRIRIIHPEEEKAFEWETIKSIYEYKEGIIFVDKENNAVLLIPKRAFSENSSIDEIKSGFAKMEGKEILQLA
jgi:hypothetical protein